MTQISDTILNTAIERTIEDVRMHTLRLTIHDTIYDKLMGLLEMLPKDKIEIIEENEYPAISFDEAKLKVEQAMNNISKNEGIDLTYAIEKVIHS